MVKKQNRLEFEYIDINKIKEPTKNLLLISDAEQEKVNTFIKKHGQILPVITDTEGVIVQGIQIYRACKSIGFEEIAIVKIGNLSEHELYQYTIALNKIVSMTEIDFKVIDEELRYWFSSEETVLLPEDICMTSVEIDSLLFTPVLNDEKEVEEEAENPLEQITPITKLGDLIKLGNHLLYCGDSKDKKTFELLMKNKTADVVITDPPYGCKIQGNVTKQKHHKEFVECSDEPTSEEFINFLSPALENLKQFSRENSLQYYFIDWRRNYELQAVCKKLFPKFINLAVWAKKQGGMGTFYRSQHELCFIYQNGTGKHINNIQLGANGRNRSNIWNYAGMNTATKEAKELRKLHSTVKPAGMLMDILLDSTNIGDIVLDCFGGSGSTLIAAEQTGRKARLIELNPQYCDVIIARWEALTGKKHKIINRKREETNVKEQKEEE